MNYINYTLIFKALGDETRLKIVSILSEQELCACEILTSFNITQPTLSYHMKLLVDSGLVSSVKDGSWIKYKLNNEIKNSLVDFLSQTNHLNILAEGCEKK